MSPPSLGPLPDFAEVELGRTKDVFELDGLAECRAATLSIARQFTRTLDIISRDLDARLYDDADFIAGVRATVVANRRARVRLLVRDPGPAVRGGHRLVELATRLSTYFEIRVLARQHAEYNRAALVADGVASVNRPLSDRYEAIACFASRSLAGELVREFEELWLAARSDPGLRRLRL